MDRLDEIEAQSIFILREAVARMFEQVRDDLAGPEPNGIERVLAERAAVCRLAAYEADLACAGRRCRVTPSSWSSTSAVATGRTGEQLQYASPVEMLFSPDGMRLYVLCQQSAQALNH